jgi:hypothetical protein
MSLEIANDALPFRRKPEDTSSGCRLLASDDRERAEQSSSAHMRLRLINSAGAWNARAALLDRLEARRVSVGAAPSDAPAAGENDNG